jgi:hypothetical protein
MKTSLIRDAIRIAREKLPRHPEFDHWPHFTFVVQDNKIIEWGYNHDEVPPIHFGYHQRLDWNMPKTHSELAAWRSAKGLIKPNRGFETINIRLTRKGELKDSKPCSCCFSFLKTMGCSACHFSTNLGFARIGMN